MLLLASVASAMDAIPMSTKCDVGKYYDTFSYRCAPLSDIFTKFDPDVIANGTISCKIKGQLLYIDAAGSIKCIATQPSTSERVDDIYIEKSLLNTNKNLSICKAGQSRFPKYCQAVANEYVFSGFDQTDEYYTYFNPTTANGNQNGYQFWPQNIPWVQYNANYNRIQDVQIISNHFTYNQISSIVVAFYSAKGDFYGFRTLTTELNFCGAKNDVSQYWRVFGTNYKSNCKVNLTELTNIEDVLIEPFYLDGENLRPIPVVVHNTNSRYPVRRFYVKHFNQLPYEYTTFASKISINFPVSNDDATIPNIPYIDVTYTNFEADTAEYTFKSEYVQNKSNFWTNMIIVASVFGALAICYFIFRSYNFIQHFGDDGFDGIVIVGIIAEFLHVAGVLIFFIVFVFSFYILAFYKWQTSIFLCLPTEEELKPLLILQWVSFACLLVASIIKVIIQTNSNVFVVDWEKEPKKGVLVSCWRRRMIADQYVSIFTERSYSVPFTVITIIFILIGCNTDLMATPVMSTKMIDTGITYKVLRFAYTSMLFLIFMLVEWVFNTFIKWGFIGNPFTNFLDLCATANTSVFMMISSSYGYYLHGRSVHGPADVDMEKLHNNLAMETQNNIGERGLVPNSKDQVFEIYLHPSFRNTFKDTYAKVQSKVKPRVLVNEKVFTSASVSQEALASFPQLNNLLTNFITKQDGYEIKPAPFKQKYLGMAETVSDKSVFLIEADNSFKNGLLAGIEWTLMLFYVLLFTGVETETSSPAIAAMIVIVVDALMVVFCKRRARADIAKKSLIDNRFLLS